MLARLRKNETYLALAAGFEISLATVCRYVHEAVDLLSAMAPTLAQAAARNASVLLAGPVIRIDRSPAPRTGVTPLATTAAPVATSRSSPTPPAA